MTSYTLRLSGWARSSFSGHELEAACAYPPGNRICGSKWTERRGRAVVADSINSLISIPMQAGRDEVWAYSARTASSTHPLHPLLIDQQSEIEEDSLVHDFEFFAGGEAGNGRRRQLTGLPSPSAELEPPSQIGQGETLISLRQPVNPSSTASTRLISTMSMPLSKANGG
jgi:hypothetical protein